MSTPPGPIEAFVHGLSGPVGLIEGPEAVALLAHCDLGTYLREHRGVNPALDRAVAVLRLVSAAHRAGAGCAVATLPAEPAQLVPLSGGPLTTGQVASLAGVTPSAVTRAIREGRLHAERVGGRWLIDAESAARYRKAIRRYT